MAAPVVPLVLTVAAGVYLGWRAWSGRRRAERMLAEFQGRWGGRSLLVTPCRVWRAGRRAEGAAALTPAALVLVAEGTSDLEVPLAVVREGAVQSRPDGRKLVGIRVLGEPIFLELAPAMMARLVEELEKQPPAAQ